MESKRTIRRTCKDWYNGKCDSPNCRFIHKLPTSAGVIVLFYDIYTKSLQIVVTEKPRCKTEMRDEHIRNVEELKVYKREVSAARAPSGGEIMFLETDLKKFRLALKEGSEETGISQDDLRKHICKHQYNNYIDYTYNDGCGVQRVTRYHIVHFNYDSSKDEHPRKHLGLKLKAGIDELSCIGTCFGRVCLDCSENCNHLCDDVFGGECNLRHGIHLWDIEKWGKSRQKELYKLLMIYLSENKCI
jgi:hypothetical protein